MNRSEKACSFCLDTKYISYRRIVVLFCTSMVSLIWIISYMYRVVFVNKNPITFYSNELIGYNISSYNSHCAFTIEKIAGKKVEFSFLYQNNLEYIIDILVSITFIIISCRVLLPFLINIHNTIDKVKFSTNMEYILVYTSYVIISLYFMVIITKNDQIYNELTKNPMDYWIFSSLRSILPSENVLNVCNDYYITCPEFLFFYTSEFPCKILLNRERLIGYNIHFIGDISEEIMKYVVNFNNSFVLEMIMIPIVIVIGIIIILVCMM